MVKVMITLIRMSPPIPDAHGLMPAALWIITARPIRPNTAPEAPTVGAFGSTRRTPKEPAKREAM